MSEWSVSLVMDVAPKQTRWTVLRGDSAAPIRKETQCIPWGNTVISNGRVSGDDPTFTWKYLVEGDVVGWRIYRGPYRLGETMFDRPCRIMKYNTFTLVNIVFMLGADLPTIPEHEDDWLSL